MAQEITNSVTQTGKAQLKASAAKAGGLLNIFSAQPAVSTKISAKVDFSSVLQRRQSLLECMQAPSQETSTTPQKKSKKLDEQPKLVVPYGISADKFNPNEMPVPKASSTALEHANIRSVLQRDGVKTTGKPEVTAAENHVKNENGESKAKVQTDKPKSEIAEEQKAISPSPQNLQNKSDNAGNDKVQKPAQSDNAAAQIVTPSVDHFKVAKQSDNSGEQNKKLKKIEKDSPSVAQTATATENRSQTAGVQQTKAASKAPVAEIKSANQTDVKQGSEPEIRVDQAQQNIVELAQASRNDGNASIRSDKVTRTEPESITTQISGSINTAYSRPGQQITVNLNPPELGKVTIRFQKDGDTISGKIEVERTATRDQIQAALPRMLQNTQDSGLQLNQIEVVMADQPKPDFNFNAFADRQSPAFSDHQQSAGENQHSANASSEAMMHAADDSAPQTQHQSVSDKSLNFLA